ncbi:MAG TPA: hypothetical protein VGR63_17610, partial [Casimicrobiaceae bacterium]|nr:hypothetical protein [Casimicrobiaceae bacterium]
RCQRAVNIVLGLLAPGRCIEERQCLLDRLREDPFAAFAPGGLEAWNGKPGAQWSKPVVVELLESRRERQR